MSEPLDIEALRAEFLNRDFDEQHYTLTAEDIAQYSASCGEITPRFTDPAHPDFQAPPTMAATLQPHNYLPTGFPKIAGLGMDAGRAVRAFGPIRPGMRLTGRTHMHDIYAKTGRSGRMVFFVKRMEVTGPEGERLAHADISTVIREKPAAQRADSDED